MMRSITCRDPGRPFPQSVEDEDFDEDDEDSEEDEEEDDADDEDETDEPETWQVAPLPRRRPGELTRTPASRLA
jgi:hypothetical protein